MVMRRSAHNVSVLAARQIEPFDDAELDHQLECSEQGRAPDPQASVAPGQRKIRGGEVTVEVQGEVSEGPSRGRDPIAGGVERAEDRVGGKHPHMMM